MIWFKGSKPRVSYRQRIKFCLKAALQVRDLDVELHVVPVELVVVVRQKVVTLKAKVFDDGVKLVDKTLHSLELRVRVTPGSYENTRKR